VPQHRPTKSPRLRPKITSAKPELSAEKQRAHFASKTKGEPTFLNLDERGKGVLAHRNKVAVFNHDGDDIFSASTRELGNSVKDACAAMLSSKK
jgi:hypothetical protein